MTTTLKHVWHCAIYGGDGVVDEVAVERDCADREPGRPFVSATERVPVRKIMSRDLVCVRPDLDLVTAVSLMISHHLGCLPVVDERRHPVGIVTKFDFVEQLDAAMRGSASGLPLPGDLRAQTVDDLMMPVVFALDEDATVMRASSLMVIEDTHHILVTSRDGGLVGVVSTKDIVRWLTGDEAAPRREVHSSASREH